MYVYDFKLKILSLVNSDGPELRSHASFLYRDDLYVYGGMNGQNQINTILFAYNIRILFSSWKITSASNTWRVIKDSTGSGPKVTRVKAFLKNDCAYIFGGNI